MGIFVGQRVEKKVEASIPESRAYMHVARGDLLMPIGVAMRRQSFQYYYLIAAKSQSFQYHYLIYLPSADKRVNG